MDSQIKFDPEQHRYYQDDGDTQRDFTSVTTFISSYGTDFDTGEILERVFEKAKNNPNYKYYGFSKSEILELWGSTGEIASAKGTLLHSCVETYLKQELEYQQGLRNKMPSANPAIIKNSKGTAVDNVENWKGFINFRKDNPWILHASEEVIWDVKCLIAGTPDALFEDPDVKGSYILVDWKTSKPMSLDINKFTTMYQHWSIIHIPQISYWTYALQLNMYRALLERQGKKITKMYIVRVGPTCGPSLYEMTQMPLLETEIKNLLDSREKTITNE